jgi:hypothetical protein
MKALLAIEWLKIKRYRTFWILVAFFVILLPLWNQMIAGGLLTMGGGGVNFLSRAYSFPGVWENVGFWGSIFVIFLSMLVIILTTNEYTYRTHRQNVIDGWSRMQFYHAKVWLVIALSLAATIYLFLNGAVFGLTHYGDLSDMFEKGEQILYFFILSVNYLGFALVISIWIKRSGLAIGVFMLYILIIENMLKGLINWTTKSQYGNFLPLQSSDELLPFPMMSMAQQLLKQTPPPHWAYIAASAGWCVLYYLYGRDMIQRRDQ